MVRLAGLAKEDTEATGKVRKALSSGRGLEIFRQIVTEQGGDPRIVDDPNLLPSVSNRELFKADRSGYIAKLDAELIGRAAMVLGAGRNRAEDSVDHAVGAVVHARFGSRVKSGDALVELHYRAAERVPAAMELLRSAITIGDGAPTIPSLVYEVIR